jgi:protein-L-isoaspartate(D-aspartate) O-methyltransferase
MNPTLDVERARFNMVEQQIRTWEVLDQQVLDLLFEVRREGFVPAAYRTLAFADMEIPLGHGQSMMAPKVEARIVQELAVKKNERVLEIGTGSGYLTALLAKRALQVTSVDIFPDFSDAARKNLQLAGIPNVQFAVGDAARAQRAVIGMDNFDVVVLTGSTPALPGAFLELLNPGGRLFAVVGDAPAMQAELLTKGRDGAIARAELFETVLAPLINAEQPARFEF